MSSFFGGSSSPTPPQQSTEDRKNEIMKQVKQELALANLQELVQKMSDNCYQKCVPAPAASLSSSDETCLQKCMDRYMETFNIVAQSYETRIRSEIAKSGDS